MLATTKVYGCIAHPIDHVKAPTLFTSIFNKKNIDAVMIPIHVYPENLENVVNSLKLVRNFHGMTVTIPHKQLITKLCKKLDDDALFTGAVNWIKFDEERNLIGTNFDGKGFVNGFLGQNYFLKDKRVCIFGAGGAAVAIAYAMTEANIKSLKIINRDKNKAFDLKEKLNAKYKSLRVDVSNIDNYILNDCDIIINATSLGLSESDKIPFDVSKTLSDSIIADIIMQPKETKLLKTAKNLGRSIHYGKYMIESQIDLVGQFLEIW